MTTGVFFLSICFEKIKRYHGGNIMHPRERWAGAQSAVGVGKF